MAYRRRLRTLAKLPSRNRKTGVGPARPTLPQLTQVDFALIAAMSAIAWFQPPGEAG